MPARNILIVALWLSLSGCATQTETQIVKIKPEPRMMADCGWAERGGETLGAYKDWAFAQSEILEKCNAWQAAERKLYGDDAQ